MDRDATDYMSDDETSLPDFQLNAVTEALLADFVPQLIVSPQEFGAENKDGQGRRSTRVASQPQQISSLVYKSSRRQSGGPIDSDGGTNTGSLSLPPRRLPKRPIAEASASEDDVSDKVAEVARDSAVASPVHVRQSAASEPFSDSETQNQAAARASELAEAEAADAQPDGVFPQQHTAHATEEYAQQKPRGVGQESFERSPWHSHDGRVKVTESADFGFRRVFVGPTTQVDPLGGCRPRTAASTPPLVATPVAVPPDLRATAASEGPRVPEKRRVTRRFTVNTHTYTVLRKLGGGGSGRVYEVMSVSNHAWAIKTIPLRNMDVRARKQLENEVTLLQSLTEAHRVVFLEEWMIDETRNCLLMVMELGQSDFDVMWKKQVEHNPRLDLTFVGYYWLEMVRCVALIHDLGVVHSDLKPANFVLAKGVLKLVDFGIANALPDDTVNIYLDHQAGTPNYMAPETLKALSAGTQVFESRAYRFGKPSDIWSLGCIFYQMVYGRQPFAHIHGHVPKFLAICNPQHKIEYPSEGLGGVNVPQSYMRTMSACLTRDASKRPTAQVLLSTADGLLEPTAKTDGPAVVTSRDLEAIFADAIRQAGSWASAEEIKALAGNVMEKFDNT